MLEGNRQIYEELANTVLPDWGNMDKNDLVRKACECKSKNLKDAYVAAIMLKYWNKLSTYSYKCKLAATPEDVHTWLVLAVMYAIDNQPWDNPKSTIYKDKNGPDKVINRVMESRRVTYYQQLNRYKRKVNSAAVSLDSLVDEYKDVFSPTYEDDYSFAYNSIVVDYFNRGSYFTAFFLDALLYADVIEDTGINNRKMSLHMRKLQQGYYETFAYRYELKLSDVMSATDNIVKLSSRAMKTSIEYNIIKLRNKLKGDI